MNKKLIDKIKALYEKGQREEALQALIYHTNKKPKLEGDSIQKLIKLSSEWIESEPTLEAYEIRGLVYYKINEQEKAISDFSCAINIDPTVKTTYIYRGIAFDDIGENQNAIEDYNKAIEIDPNYKLTYFYRASTYSKLKEYQKAINDYSKTIEIDPNYISSYNNRGLTYSDLKEYQKANNDFNKAIEINPKNADYYYSRGLSYKRLGIYEKALDDFKKHIELGDTEYWVEKSQNQIKEIEEIQKNSIIKDLNKNIDEIKDVLLYEEEEITHYTGLTTSAILIDDKESLFRLSESSFLNDTSEGQRLNKYLELNNGITPKTNAIPFIKKPFIGSFVSGDKSNELTLWRMYAKENQEEAKGCSLRINKDQFVENIRNTVSNSDKESNPINDDFKFYRVSYLNKDNKSIIPGLVKDDEVKLDNALESLKETVSKISKLNDGELNRQVIERLNAIEYLFKDDAYFYENEIRLVIDGIGIKKKCSELNSSPRVYIEIAPIRSALKSITIGPKVERAEEWATLFHYHLNQDSKQETEIKLSRLPFK